MLAAKMQQKSINMYFCQRFSREMTPPALKKVSEGCPRGRPVTLRQAFLGPAGGCYADFVDVQGHSKALKRLNVLKEAL